MLIYWFKVQANKSARTILSRYYDQKEIDALIRAYWNEYFQPKGLSKFCVET